MNEQRQIEALAKIEFGDDVVDIETLQDGTIRFWSRNDNGTFNSQYRDYTSLDALQPLIDGMGDKDRNETFNWLWRLTNTSDVFLIPSHCGCTIQATPAQKAEAILRAFYVWETGDTQNK